MISNNQEHLDTFRQNVPAVGCDDVNLHFHALQWATGFQTLYPYIFRGGRTVIMNDRTFDPELVVDMIVAEGVTGALIPGPMLTSILDSIERRGGIQHRLRRVVIFFATPEQLRRVDRMINTGYHVYPAEIEAAISEFPGILSVRVSGEKHPRWGEMVVAYLVANWSGTTEELIDQLRKTLVQRLAIYKIPREFRVVDRLP